MTMKLFQAIETFVPVENSSDLLLLGIDGIQHANPDFAAAHYYKTISDNNKITKLIGSGPLNKFFYKICSYKDNVVVGYERGIGYAYIDNDKEYFKREIPLIYGKNETHVQYIENNILRFIPSNETTNIITYEIPPTLTALYYDKNCLLVSKDSFCPSSLQIAENSFVGRVGEYDVNNINFDSSDFVDIVASALCKYSKQISLKCSKLNANKLAIKQLQLEDNDGSGARAGTFVYDKENDVVKFYNGTTWRSLKWVDEEKTE